ncbi:MAG TPA: bifunctional UDP-N-acetylglucosamine diphosphorylase/glucosamine-1-phosphate N-acetyltransferase GlmU [Mycobacteriales bacterium]|nr:bifunctional UDP-N-acetylglucosamine diphosphorylase/glucosamine-1-phosphate N-acetyltransferase GlmU [Mycobacteriales bacterium]
MPSAPVHARPSAVIVLAAGEGTRMKSATPKVLHRLGGRTMLGHVLAAAEALDPEHLLVVVGHGREEVSATLSGKARGVVQETQDGTGHAVRVALAALGALDGTVVVLPGDSPLITAATLQALVEEHEGAGAATTLLTALVDDPTGYGRVVRDDHGVRAVVEHKDADEATLAVREINTSVYAFECAALRESLGRLTTDNAQGELYLTDVVALHREAGRTVGAVVADDADETLGCNDRAQLADLARKLRDRTNEAHLRAGVAILDPQSTWIDVDVVLEPDATIDRNTSLHGNTVVRRDASVGPDSTLTDCEVGPGATVTRTQATGAVIGARATVGPFSYLRPGTLLGEGAKVGAYVEVKGSEIGAGSKVPHLAYVGDATVGERSNIGAGTIVVNYDGVAKHRTTVGDDARIGSNNSLVAPVEIGDGAYTAAGSAITGDVPPGALGVGRAKQRNIEGWVARKRPKKGTS